MDKHTCGGLLNPVKVKIRKKTGLFFQTFTVDGYKCDNCGEEIISRDMALAIDEAIENLKSSWTKWRVPGDTKETPVVQQNFVAGTATKKLLIYEGTTNVRPY